MYQVGDYVVYNRKVCKMVAFKKNRLNGEDYYVLQPLQDMSLKIELPVANQNLKIRSLMTSEEITSLISRISSIPVLEVQDRSLEAEYRRLYKSDVVIDLITIIKTTYLRNQKRAEERKNPGERDLYYFNQAETQLYEEIALVLGLTYDEAKNYVIEKATTLEQV